MATGMVDNWANIDVFGPIYPFVGTEFVFVMLGIAFWIIWHILQIKAENAEFREDVENIKNRGGVGKVLDGQTQREVSDLAGG